MAKSKTRSPSTKKCGAKTRWGGQCKNFALPSGRCKLHGGMSTGPRDPSKLHGNTNTLKHGVYSKAIRGSEEELYDAISVGSVDEELKLCRLRLARAAAAEVNITDANPNDPALPRIHEEINRILSRIDRLENRRAQLIDMGASDDDPHEVARSIAAALDEIEGLTATIEEAADGDPDA